MSKNSRYFYLNAQDKISICVQERYSSPVICLDLVKAAEKSPREIVLRSEFDTAISYINQSVCAPFPLSRGAANASGAV